MTIDLKDKVAVITGASRGIGEAIAAAYASSGAKVVLASRKLEGLEVAAAKIRDAGGVAEPVACHTGKPEAVAALLQQAVAKFGKVDILVNNAATNPYFGPMMNVQWAAWDKTFDVNVKGYFSTIKAFVEHLDAAGAPGAVVNITSILGTTAASMQGVYGMTKAAVISMTKTLAMELAGRHIRVNAIAPGFVETRFSQALLTNEPLKKMIVDRTPLDRVAQPDDIAGAAVFLGSDAARFITGEVITVDGGLTIGV